MTSSRRRCFRLRVAGELRFHYIAVELALLVKQGRRSQADAVRAVIAARAIAAHDTQRHVQRVVGHWHAIFIGRPADRGISVARSALSAPALRAHDKDPPLASQYHVRSRTPRFRVKAGFDPGRGRSCRPERHGACLLPRSFPVFCQLKPHVSLLVFLLVSG
jgi:hypothetical protein